MSSDYIIYRIMKRLDDDSLISPFVPYPFTQISMSNNIKKIIPYGFAFNHIEKANMLMNDNQKLELWIIQCENFINIEYELHSYRMIKLASEYHNLIGDCLFKNNFENIPIKIGKSIPSSGTIFCKNIEIIEKVSQNY